MTVYIVYAHFDNNLRAALKVFATHDAAHAHITRCTVHPWDDDGRQQLASPAEILGITGFSVEALRVEGGTA